MLDFLHEINFIIITCPPFGSPIGLLDDLIV